MEANITIDELIKNLWKAWESVAETGELICDESFSKEYDKLKIQVDKYLNQS